MSDPRQDVLDLLRAHGLNRAQPATYKLIATLERELHTGDQVQHGTCAVVYYENGRHRRIDESFGDPWPFQPAWAGRTLRLVSDGSKSIAVERPDRVTIRKAEPFMTRSELVRLAAFAFCPDFHSHAGQIQQLLERWDPHQDAINVHLAQQDEAALTTVRYETTRGGSSRWQWTFDPSRGHEIVEALMCVQRPTGEIGWRMHLRYDVREVATNVWRPGGLEYDSEESIGPAPLRGLERVRAQSLTTDADLGDQLFTLEGLGIAPGTRIADSTGPLVRWLVHPDVSR